MSATRSAIVFTVALVASISLLPLTGIAQSDAPSPDWVVKKQEMMEFGKQFDSAWAMYEAFRRQADLVPPKPEELPEWSGLWDRVASPMVFDPDRTGLETTANLKGRYAEMMREQIENAREGNVWDPHGGCGMPRGYPGMLKNGRPHEFAVTPHQTWHMAQARNEVRRIYTDGRPHTPPEYAYDTPHGDTIGFWDGDKLITHTKYTDGGWIGRLQPYLSNQLEGTEVWQKIDEQTIQADVWLYDPEALEEPWYTRQIYKKIPREEGMPLRLTYWWNCEAQNNVVIPTEDGGTTFLNFDFTDVDDQPAEDPR